MPLYIVREGENAIGTAVWGGESGENYLTRPLKKLCHKYMILGTSGMIWGDFGTLLSDFRMENHSM